MEVGATIMAERLYASHIGEAVTPYILDPALMRLAGIALFIAGIWMLIVMAIMKD
jgi:hypothetical protein